MLSVEMVAGCDTRFPAIGAVHRQWCERHRGRCRAVVRDPDALTALLASWKARRGGRAAPVLLVVLHPGGAALCGVSGEEPPIYPKVDAGQVERLCREALDQPDRHAALRFLSQALPSLETALPGLNNEGLVALHELQHCAPGRQDWADSVQK